MAFPHDVLNEGDPTLKPGDEVLRYGLNSDGNWNLWAEGAWHKLNSGRWSTKAASAASATKAWVTSPLLRGVKERWIEVRTNTGQEGWVLMEKTTDRIWHSGTFGDLCILD